MTEADDEEEFTGEVLPDNAYAEEAPLTPLLDNSARVKIIGALLSERGNPLNKSDIARLAGVTRQTVKKHVPQLLEMGVINEVVVDGIASYEYRTDTAIGKLLYTLESAAWQRLAANRPDIDHTDPMDPDKVDAIFDT